jgi:hypothetical protein
MIFLCTHFETQPRDPLYLFFRLISRVKITAIINKYIYRLNILPTESE